MGAKRRRIIKLMILSKSLIVNLRNKGCAFHCLGFTIRNIKKKSQNAVRRICSPLMHFIAIRALLAHSRNQTCRSNLDFVSNRKPMRRRTTPLAILCLRFKTVRNQNRMRLQSTGSCFDCSPFSSKDGVVSRNMGVPS